MTMEFTPQPYRRRPTRVVTVGEVGIGGTHPIRVQSMTTPATTDTAATVAQIVRLVEAGCEIVRVTVPTTADADNLPAIRNELRRLRVRVPLVADIHFTPAAALKAVEHVEKIRINPGNYADKKKFAVREYSDADYAAELERIDRAFGPLVDRCRTLGVALRIGTNHGSLSDRIMNRYGDSPEGMVESALEFVRMCEARGFRDLVLSMKASNPRVVLAAYRLLVARMDAETMDYPLHLGVTEAGDGEDGRIKSAIGIGPLLEDGIGDTVRVSLTEDPVAEIPVARALVAPYNARPSGPAVGGLSPVYATHRVTGVQEGACVAVDVGPRRIGGLAPVLVEVPLASPPSAADAVRREIDALAGARVPEETRAELVSIDLGDRDEVAELARLRAAMELVAPRVAISAKVEGSALRFREDRALDRLFDAAHRVHAVVAGPPDGENNRLLDRLLARVAERRASLLLEAGSDRGRVEDAVALGVEAARRFAGSARLMLAIDPGLDRGPLVSLRGLVDALAAAHLAVPLVLVDRPDRRASDPTLGSATQIGGLLCEGVGQAIHVDTGDSAASRRLSFNILQGARVRMTKTEFISCPSCGRTLFDLESTTATIKQRTSHLKGLKIAVMGCIVNGPGEMADADFGYVGWGDDKIALFVGKEMVEKDIPTGEAADRLVALIKRHGKWVEPAEIPGV